MISHIKRNIRLRKKKREKERAEARRTFGDRILESERRDAMRRNLEEDTRKALGMSERLWRETKDIITSKVNAGTPFSSLPTSRFNYGPYVKLSDPTYTWSKKTSHPTVSSKPKEPIEKAEEGFVKVKSKGPNDIRLITDDGSIINLPIHSATWEMVPNEIPILTLKLPADIDADGCIMKAIKGKKTVSIEDFINKAEEIKEGDDEEGSNEGHGMVGE